MLLFICSQTVFCWSIFRCIPIHHLFCLVIGQWPRYIFSHLYFTYVIFQTVCFVAGVGTETLEAADRLACAVTEPPLLPPPPDPATATVLRNWLRQVCPILLAYTQIVMVSNH